MYGQDMRHMWPRRSGQILAIFLHAISNIICAILMKIPLIWQKNDEKKKILGTPLQ